MLRYRPEKCLYYKEKSNRIKSRKYKRKPKQHKELKRRLEKIILKRKRRENTQKESFDELLEFLEKN